MFTCGTRVHPGHLLTVKETSTVGGKGVCSIPLGAMSTSMNGIGKFGRGPQDVLIKLGGM